MFSEILCEFLLFTMVTALHGFTPPRAKALQIVAESSFHAYLMAMVFRIVKFNVNLGAKFAMKCTAKFSREKATHKHKQVCGIVLCFLRSYLMGVKKKHINKCSPQNSRDNPMKMCLRVSFGVFFLSLPSFETGFSWKVRVRFFS